MTAPAASEKVQYAVQETMPAFEATWTENAEGLPQADVVIIRPGESANRRDYSREAIAEAVKSGFWDNTSMFVNHGDSKMPRKRDVTHLRARIDKGSTYIGAEGEARGRVTFIDPAFATFARNAGPSIGLSAVHEFMGQRYRGNDGHYHERVNKFVVNHSVDFVAFPAAGGEIAQFLPAQESEDDVDYNSPLLTLDALKQHRHDIIEALAAESDGPDPQPEPEPIPEPPTEPPAPQGYVTLAQAKSIAQEAAEHVRDEFVERDRKVTETRTKVSAHVAKSGLPEKTKNRLMAAFESAEEYKADAVQEAIEAAAEEAKELGWRGPKVIGLGDSSATEADDKGDDPATLKKLYPTMMAVEEQMAFTSRKGRTTNAAEAN